MWVYMPSGKDDAIAGELQRHGRERMLPELPAQDTEGIDRRVPVRGGDCACTLGHGQPAIGAVLGAVRPVRTSLHCPTNAYMKHVMHRPKRVQRVTHRSLNTVGRRKLADQHIRSLLVCSCWIWDDAKTAGSRRRPP